MVPTERGARPWFAREATSQSTGITDQYRTTQGGILAGFAGEGHAWRRYPVEGQSSTTCSSWKYEGSTKESPDDD
jgi:hypothetical protein